ncbi:MAG: glycosyltransferase [Lachnospiraceae bacterium]|nr:glycosyltransferase [Lachnospiraceae bacterium]
MGKKCSIIIPTKDKNSRLYLTLKCLEPQMTDETEVIVVFDGCKEETVEEFKTFTWSMDIKPIISKQNVGRAAARNLGLREATGDVVIFLDDDRLTRGDFIKGHLARHTGEPCVVLGERMDAKVTENELLDLMNENRLEDVLDFVSKHSKKEFYYNIKKWFVRKPRGSYRFMTFITGNVSIDRCLMNDIAGFDESFKGWGYEDTDVGYRLAQKDIPYYQDNSIICYHLLHPHVKAQKAKEELINLKHLKSKFPDDRVLGGAIRFYTLKAKLKL